MFLLEKLLHTDCYHTFLAIRTIIGHNDYLVRALAYLVLKDNQILRTTSHHRQYTIASGLQCLNDWQHGSHAKSTTSTDDGAVFLNLRGVTQRTNHICYIVAFVERT